MTFRPSITGLHHVTAMTSDAQRNIDFYTGVLGLRLVKLTVNFDDPGSYHLYYGDELGRPGSALTFFAWPGAARGRAGLSQVTTTAFSAPPGSLDFWQQRLEQYGHPTNRQTRFGAPVLVTEDFDGMKLELVEADDARMPWLGGPVGVDQALRGFHSVTAPQRSLAGTQRLLTDTMGLRLVGSEGSRHRFAAGDGTPGALFDIAESTDAPRGSMGAGTVHHVAWRTPDDEHQQAWLQTLQGRHNVSPIMDRVYFHSIYFREPGGVLFEIATDTPGFTVDEPVEALGTSLRLPPWLEEHRPMIARALPRVTLPQPVRV